MLTETEKRALEAAGDHLVGIIREELRRSLDEAERPLLDEPEDWPDGKL